MESGTSLGPYRIDRELGSGGMGRVYAATIEGRCPGFEPGASVALKVVHPHLLETPGYFRRFLREAELGASIRHENVVRTLLCDQLVVDGRSSTFLVMEYVDGQTLRGLLDELERVPEELCRHVAREVCKGLAAIHAAGIVHRDVKPDNVIVARSVAQVREDLAERSEGGRSHSTLVRAGGGSPQYDYVVKVMDLGVARLQDEAVRLSQTGAFVGSLHYAAPECFRAGGRAVDGRADLHALGLVLYELSCGNNPYLADDVPQTLRKVLHDVPRRLGDVNPQLSPFFEELVHTLLAKEPDARFASASELLAVLEDGEESAWWRQRAKSIRAETRRPIRRIRIPRETAVYGRGAELAKLRALFERAKVAEGQVALIEGEAGIGKSRLVDELIAQLQRDGEDLNFLFGSYPPGGAATAAGAFATAYREHFGAAGSVDYLARTPLLAPAFDALLAGAGAPTGVQQVTKDSLQTCFVNATYALADERPTVILIDDLHFAPEEGRSLLTSLAMAVPGRRVLLVGTTRLGISADWVAGLTRLDHTTQMTLPRLGPKDLTSLLLDAFQSEQLAQDLGFRIAQKSDGNPFFAFEIVRGLREGHYIRQNDDGSWVTTQVIEEIQIPGSVLDMVNARVAGLSEDERALLDVAACWGYEFDPCLVGEVLGIARIPALRSFGQVERRHRLVRSSGRRYVFDHHQVQEALYGSINEQLREEYHAALAESLESRTGQDPATLDGVLCVELCSHYLRGAQGDRALRYLDAALESLTQGYLNDDVLALCDRALAFPGLLEGPDRGDVLLRKSDRLNILGRREEQETVLAEAGTIADASGDPALRARFERSRARMFWTTSRYEESLQAGRRAVALYQGLGDRSGEAVVFGRLGLAEWRLGRFADATEHFERQAEIAREIGDQRSEARAHGNLASVCQAQGRREEMRAHNARALSLYRENGDRLGEAACLGNMATVVDDPKAFAEKQELQTRALAIWRQTGSRKGEATELYNRGQDFMRLGDLPRAAADFRTALDLAREIGFALLEAVTLMSIGDLREEEGDQPAAHEYHAAGIALFERMGSRGSHAANAHLGHGAFLIRSGSVESGREHLERAQSMARDAGMSEIPARVAAELAAIGAMEASEAERIAELARDELPCEAGREVRFLLWKATADPAHLLEAKRLLDEVVAGRPDDYRESILSNIKLNREIMAAARENGITP